MVKRVVPNHITVATQKKKKMEYLKIGKNWNMSKDVMYVQEYI